MALRVAPCASPPQAATSALRWVMASGAPVGAGAIAVDQVSVLARDGQPYTLVEGRTGDGVTGVTLALGNGSEVTATNGNGALRCLVAREPEHHLCDRLDCDRSFDPDLEPARTWYPALSQVSAAVSSWDTVVLHSECGSRLFGRDGEAILKVPFCSLAS